MNATFTPETDLVVVAEAGGVLDDRILHLPAATKTWQSGLHLAAPQTIGFDEYEYPPLSWPSACGEATGFVYRHGGVFEHTPVCGTCMFVVHPQEQQRKEWRDKKRRQRAEKRTVKPRLCANAKCGLIFTPEKFQQSRIFCSVECRRVVYRIRYRDYHRDHRRRVRAAKRDAA